MKSKYWPQYLIALTVIGCSLTLLTALTFALSGYHWGVRGRRLNIEFADATGIKMHSDVRYAGAVAGRVVGIRYLTAAERSLSGKRDFAVRVTVALNADVPLVPADSKAGLSSETILGEKFIALSAGTPSAGSLPDDAVIQGQSMSGLDTLTQSLEKTAGAATELLEKFNTDYPELKTNLTRLLSVGDTLLTAGTNLISDAQRAVGDVRRTLQGVDTTVGRIAPQASNLLAEATVAATNLNHTLDNTRAITTDVHEFLTNQFLANLDQNMRNLTSVLARIEVASEYAKILANRLAEKPSRLIWQRRVNPVPTEAEIIQHQPPPVPPKAKK
jgi:phospholipid/cholesterol/gamma-HCH transport system substrate-binding protein